jgi:hypothetical protein
MDIAIESTSRIVTLLIDGAEVPARVWQGHTASGVPVHAFITRIAPTIDESHPRIDELCAEFERDLMRVAAPSPEVAAIPLRLVL